MRWQLGGPGVPARSPKHLLKIPWGFMLSLGNAGEMRWRGWGGVPLLAVRHRVLEQPWGCSRLSSCPPQTYLAFAEHGGPCPGPLSWSHLSPSPGCSGPLFLSRLSPPPAYPQSNHLSLSPGPSCPCPLVLLVPSPGPLVSIS